MPICLTRAVCLVSLIGIAGCSSSSGSTADGGPGTEAEGGAPGAPGTPGAACTDGESTFRLAAGAIPYGSGTRAAAHAAHGIVVDTSGPSILLSQPRADGSVQLAFADGHGKETAIAIVPNVSTAAGEYRFLASPVIVASKRCAAFVRDGEALQLACEGGAQEDSAVKVDASKGIVPIALPDGGLSLFTQRFAAVTELRRDGHGAWREIQKFQGSISWAEDAALHEGKPFACYSSEGSGAVRVDDGGSEHGIVAKQGDKQAARCRIAAGSSGMYVLAGDSFGSIPWTTFGQYGASVALQKTSLALAANDKVLALIVVADKAFAVVDRDTKLEAVPLSGGAGIALGDGKTKATGYDAATGAFRFATVDYDSKGESDAVRLVTRCTSAWSK